jgi:hypothetical protein
MAEMLYRYYENINDKESMIFEDGKLIEETKEDNDNSINDDVPESQLEAKRDLNEAEQAHFDLLTNGMPELVRKKLDEFLDENNFTGIKAKFATILFFSHHGFFEEVKEEDTEKIHHSSWYGYSASVPIDWKIILRGPNKTGFASPECINLGFYDHEVAFKVNVMQWCDEQNESFDGIIQSILSYANDHHYEKVNGPEEFNLDGWENGVKYSFRLKENSFYRGENDEILSFSSLGGGDLYTDYYIFKYGNAYYRIYFKYSDAYKEKYMDTAEEIMKSMKFETKTCEEQMLDKGFSDKGFFKEEASVFLPDGITIYKKVLYEIIEETKEDDDVSESQLEAKRDLNEEEQAHFDLLTNGMPELVRKKLDEFLDKNNFTGIKAKFATILFFSPYGFFEEAKEKYTEKIYHNSLYGYSAKIPMDWGMNPRSANKTGFTSPDCLNSGHYDHEVAFKVNIMQGCNGMYYNSIDEFTEQILSYANNNHYEKINDPEKFNLDGWENGVKYSFRLKENSFYRGENGEILSFSALGGGDLYTDYYIFEYGDTYYRIYFKYSDAYKEKYMDTAEEIMKSMKLGTKTCEEQRLDKGFSDDEASIFFPGGITLYEKALYEIIEENQKDEN